MSGADHYKQYNDAAQFTEADWIAGLTARDHTVIALCYDRYAPALYGYILKTVKTESVAAPILSAAFLHIIKGIGDFVPGDVRLFTWMLRITHLEMIRQTGEGFELPPMAHGLPGGS
ncbi:Sigma-70 region 2 [Chitinophaga costaii]|uniref:Sigma-70 region 2 n=1 Tax=Chitinophaga costaii TaxID=1335309 RepID=A0A1C4EIT6_9BACT|nr:sigma factor [Chitinophaga costaii]PUZ23797.1 hypothetical protein DCM91_13435 [Chitinophaga costaii]SCC43441.1 Sigma-70 region 2 [Chitinophaga costaii]